MELELVATEDDSSPIINRMVIIKGTTADNLNVWCQQLEKWSQEQNKEEAFVQNHGPTSVEVALLEQYKRKQTPEEKREKKRLYNLKRNQREDVKEKKRLAQANPIYQEKRRLKEQDPEYKQQKRDSTWERRKALQLMQRDHERILQDPGRTPLRYREAREMAKQMAKERNRALKEALLASHA